MQRADAEVESSETLKLGRRHHRADAGFVAEDNRRAYRERFECTPRLGENDIVLP